MISAFQNCPGSLICERKYPVIMFPDGCKHLEFNWLLNFLSPTRVPGNDLITIPLNHPRSLLEIAGEGPISHISLIKHLSILLDVFPTLLLVAVALMLHGTDKYPPAGGM